MALVSIGLAVIRRVIPSAQPGEAYVVHVGDTQKPAGYDAHSWVIRSDDYLGDSGISLMGLHYLHERLHGIWTPPPAG